MLTGTVFAKTRQLPAALGLLLHGIVQGEPMARLARELGLSHKQLHTRRRANKRKGHGTSANDRPPIIRVVSRDTGQHRVWVREHVDARTGRDLIAPTTVNCSGLRHLACVLMCIWRRAQFLNDPERCSRHLTCRGFLCMPIILSGVARPPDTLQGRAAMRGITYGGAVAYDHLQDRVIGPLCCVR